ncbi:helix-turn-helix domain-containing protein [Streptomyces lunaelactis]|uniref:helix-turn-helix domain-containing protein n=1 Tax=Streptomyces lunaelactis TaxID=1535768 RepID=UPI001584D4F9|nr:helix-turn-helix transcriptional regulator [Streptomyces lunaelactis]NUK55211.1 helix-turn-helix domain-containing protein [Streptomyces lunaelactis]NUK69128.1 helix-turn-helix domain-containing protein [Streptomyces lunaelactis]
MHPRKRQRKNASAMKLVGAQLAMFREFAGLRQRELAERVCVHEETIASVEQGRRPLKPDLAKVLDRVLDTKRALETAVDNMPEIDLIPAWAEQYMEIEREAIALSFFANQVLPGLLQTENYAGAVFRNRVPAFSEEEINGLVAARLERQEILHRKVPPTVSFVLSEAIVIDRLGGDVVHKETLRHLRACADLPGFAFQVMPLGRKAHAGLNGPFILLETPDHQHLGYTETQRGSQLISDPDEVSILSRKYAMLRTQALNPEETRALLDRLLGER